MTGRLKDLQLATLLLTRVPAGQIAEPVPDLPQTVWAFPVIGAGLGLIMWAGFAGATALGLPGLTAALLALGLQALLTGGLHEDGLADTADGLGGAQDRARKLDIMRDSRIGSYGVLALILTLGLTASAMAGGAGLMAFVLIGAASRTAMLLPMAVLPPARSDGLGHSASLRFAAPTIIALSVTVLLGAIAPGTLLAMAALTAGLIKLYAWQINGQTGDTLGATQKLTECIGWLSFAALAT